MNPHASLNDRCANCGCYRWKHRAILWESPSTGQISKRTTNCKRCGWRACKQFRWKPIVGLDKVQVIG